MSNVKRVKHHTSTVVICCTQTTATGRWMMSLFVAIWQTGIHQLSTMRDMQIMWNFRSAARFMCWERGTKQTNTYDEWHSLLALFALQSAKHTTIHQCKQVLHHHTTTRQQGSYSENHLGERRTTEIYDFVEIAISEKVTIRGWERSNGTDSVILANIDSAARCEDVTDTRATRLRDVTFTENIPLAGSWRAPSAMWFFTQKCCVVYHCRVVIYF